MHGIEARQNTVQMSIFANHKKVYSNVVNYSSLKWLQRHLRTYIPNFFAVTEKIEFLI